MSNDLNEIYLRMHDDIRHARIREWDKRDDVYLKVTTGSLVLSVSFLTISGIDAPLAVNILMFAWVLLLASIICQLISYILVDLHFSKSEKELRKWARNGMIPHAIPSESTLWEKITWFVNWAGYFCTILGLISLVLFGWYNINAMTQHNPKESEKFANPLTTNPSLVDQIKPPVPQPDTTPATPNTSDKK